MHLLSQLLGRLSQVQVLLEQLSGTLSQIKKTNKNSWGYSSVVECPCVLDLITVVGGDWVNSTTNSSYVFLRFYL